MISFASMAQISAAYPDDAEYFIKGRVSVEKNANDQVMYKLYDVTSNGITFDLYRYYWGEEDGESVYFTLDKAKTNYPGGFSSGLTFWRYDEDIQQWQTDVEFKPSTADFEETKQMAVMVLIDCSGSLGDEWSVAKESAINFINLMHSISRGRGNIKIGIIGFSTIGETKIFEMQPLNDLTKELMQQFIRNDLRQSDGTALFYAMDKAVEMMEEYCNKNIEINKLGVTSMAVFTDGLDQISRNLDKDILTTDDYREYVKQLKDKKIGNTTMYSTMFGLKGVDITTDAQLMKFSHIGEELTDKFILLKNIRQLDDEFTKFAQDLTDAWQNLKCYAPNSYKGRVAWTFREIRKPQPPRRGKIFFGINVGSGMASYYNYYYDNHSNYHYYNNISAAVSGGIDLAFPIGKLFNLGVFGSGGYDFARWSYMYSFGGIGLINFNSGGSLYFGGGCANLDYDPAPDFRLGYKFRNGIYMFSEYFGDFEFSSFAVMIHFGYSF